jgi:hypothetical protein
MGRVAAFLGSRDGTILWRDERQIVVEYADLNWNGRGGAFRLGRGLF